MKNAITLIALLFLSTNLYAQRDSLVTTLPKNNAVSLELGGGGIIYSINYERLGVKHEKGRFCTKIGFCIIPEPIDNETDNIFLTEIEYLKGKKNKYLELGFGYNYVIRADRRFYYFNLRIGYRYENIKKHYYWKICYTPYLAPTSSILPYFMCGVGIGKMF